MFLHILQLSTVWGQQAFGAVVCSYLIIVVVCIYRLSPALTIVDFGIKVRKELAYLLVILTYQMSIKGDLIWTFKDIFTENLLH